VGALGHVTDIAEVALVDYLPEIRFFDAVDLSRFAFIDKIEQRRKRVAQADAPAAAVTDLEHALELLLDRRLVVVSRVLPVDRMATLGREVASACGHWPFARHRL